jgi:hypothetical protein
MKKKEMCTNLEEKRLEKRPREKRGSVEADIREIRCGNVKLTELIQDQNTRRASVSALECENKSHDPLLVYFAVAVSKVMSPNTARRDVK